jgi:hypothetical protein
MDKYRFKQLLESSMGNVKPLVLEDDDKTATFLGKYIGKTINMYKNPECTNFSTTLTITNITYQGGYITIHMIEKDGSPSGFFIYDVICLYNPNKFSNEYILQDTSKEMIKTTNYLSDEFIEKFYSKLYNKTLLNDIFTKGASSGIQFCQKPNADFGSTNPPTNNTNIT